ncbi:MAG TPA: RNase H family protein [Chloroflexota bacterium]
MTAPTTARRYGHRDLQEFNARLAELRASAGPPSATGDFVAYTDGACLGNPEGPGGWGAVIIPPPPGAAWHLFGHLSSTSNNRAEALAVLAALEWVADGSQLWLHSDSELTVRILQGRYKARANADIWNVIRETLAARRLSLHPEWVRGHAGDPLNETADRLSRLGAAGNLTSPPVEPVETLAPRAPDELSGLVPRGEWERDFLNSIAEQLRRGRSLSAKQQAVVDRIRARGPAA